MSIQYKTDILPALKKAGYSTYRIRKERIFGERTVQALRTGEMVSVDVLSKLCMLLNCQPGDMLEYVPERNDME